MAKPPADATARVANGTAAGSSSDVMLILQVDIVFSLACCQHLKMGQAINASSCDRPKDRHAAKYDLLTTVRTHTGSDDDSFSCMGLGEDKDGILGVFLRKNVVAVAGRAMSKNIAALGRLILPYSEMVRPCLPCLCCQPSLSTQQQQPVTWRKDAAGAAAGLPESADVLGPGCVQLQECLAVNASVCRYSMLSYATC